jgi:hypothetical protein
MCRRICKNGNLPVRRIDYYMTETDRLGMKRGV